MPSRLYDSDPMAPLDRVLGAGAPIESNAHLRTWLAGHPEAFTRGITFVVDRNSILRLSPRDATTATSARGDSVRAAGRLVFKRAMDSIKIKSSSNDAPEYGPDPDSFADLRRALDCVGVDAGDGFTKILVWRRCGPCDRVVLVKFGRFVCAACRGPLPEAWNVQPDPDFASALQGLREAQNVELGPSGIAMVTSEACAAFHAARIERCYTEAALRWLRLNATPAGRVYAGLLLDEIGVEKPWATLRYDTAQVLFTPGGCVYTRTSVSAIAAYASGAGAMDAREYGRLSDLRALDRYLRR